MVFMTGLEVILLIMEDGVYGVNDVVHSNCTIISLLTQPRGNCYQYCYQYLFNILDKSLTRN